MKKALKKSLSVILAITIIFSSVIAGLGEIDFSGLFAIKTKAATLEDLTFTLTEYGDSYSVTGCNASAEGEIVIPDTYNGLPVTTIGESAFSCCEMLWKITIPDSITSIGYMAFGGCMGLSSLTIPASVTNIDASITYGCMGLSDIYVNVNNSDYSSVDGVLFNKDKTVLVEYPTGKWDSEYVIPDSVESIGAYSFDWECMGLTSIIIPDSVTSIEEGAFYGSQLTSIIIPDSVTSIGKWAFNNAYNLTSITIGKGLINVGPDAFDACYVDKVYIKDIVAWNNITFESDLSNPLWHGADLYINDELATDIVIPDGVIAIPNYAFCGCGSISSIIIPDSVTSIGESTFYNCRSLTSITIPDSVTSIGDSAFYNTGYYNDSNNWEDDVLYIGNHLIKAKTSLSAEYAIKDGTKTIANSSFYNCKRLTSLTIPDSVTKIGYDAFGVCSNIKYVFYTGSQDDWNNMLIAGGNTWLTNKTIIHYDSTGHTASDWIIGVESTCSEEGSKYTECTICGEIISTEAIPTTGHTYSEEWTIDKEPTCTEEGSKSHHCSVCGDKKDVTVIEVTSHNYSTDWTIDKEATFTEAGSKSRHCMNCNAKTDVTVIPANFGDVMFVAQEGGTCNGKITYCVYLKAGTSVDGAIVNVEFDEAALDVFEGGAYTVLDSYGDLIPKVSGIYESGLLYGVKNVYSMAFVNISSKTISKDTPFMKITFDINEGYSEAAIKFTCKEFNSNNPEHNVPNTETPVLMFEETADITISEHGSSDWIVDEAATVFDDGSAHRECITCGEILETKIIPQLVCQKPELESVVQNESGLVFSWNAVEGADEYQVYRKTDSGEWTLLAVVDSASTTYIDTNVEDGKIYYYTVQAVNEAGTLGYNRVGFGCEFHVHSFGDWIITTPATCMTDGERYRVCSGCGDEEYEAITFLGHDYSTEWTIDIEPTCTEDGSKSHHCSRCESVEDVTVIGASGHSYGDWVITKVPTCTEYGALSKTCSVCGDVKTEAIAKNPHSYSTEWTIDIEPTCTEDGSKSHHCIACGDKADITVIQTNGHSYGDWFTSTEPTCTDDGSKYKVCSVCGDVVTETIDSVGHKYSSEWTIDLAPTCTEDGSKSHHCTDCGDKADITVITATGHKYEVVDVATTHPHTATYKCLYCSETKAEQETASDCLECNFTITYVKETDSYKLISYIGTQADVVIPATYNGCAVTTIANGCFKGNTSIKSVEIADGVTAIGSLAFMNCASLEKVVIPASVTSIGSQAFYKFSGTIYCTRDSFAHEYAVANNIKYFLLSILETENTKIDYDNSLIFTNVQSSNDILEILGVSDTAIAIPVASITYGNNEIYGTGTVVTVFDGDDYIGDFTLIVEGDLNGDSTCDVIDASVAYLYSVGLDEPTENEVLAANGCISDELDANAYQNVVNMMLVS